MKYRIAIIILLFSFAIPRCFSQTLEEAKEMYLAGKYADALPAFEKAIKSSPKNASYNQWYGNSLLETGKLEDSEKYLKFAASKNIQEAYSSLGKLYYLQYRFDESVAAYEESIVHLKKKKEEDKAATIQKDLNISKRAARMLSRCENIQIIDSLVISKEKFLAGYPLSEEAGTLKLLPELPGTIVYENQLKDRRYFSKPAANNHFRLYTQTELQGVWSDEKVLNIPVDSTADDNYPYVLSDGVTVYFASTGRESVGGYDLFVTRYNMNSDSYLAPEQMGMPFNSIYNDYMLVIDEFNGVGYFATDRFQNPDKIIIYTYIPNEEVKTIDSDDPSILISRAQVLSIKDSWTPGMNYQSLLQKIKDSVSSQSKTEKRMDFIFIINDHIVYNTLNDFESESAKQLFVQSQNLRQQIEHLEAELDSQRQSYSKGNKSLSSGILSNESKVEKLYNDYRKQAIEARNTEIKYLRQQQ